MRVISPLESVRDTVQENSLPGEHIGAPLFLVDISRVYNHGMHVQPSGSPLLVFRAKGGLVRQWGRSTHKPATACLLHACCCNYSGVQQN